jgi:hypothetical protein
MRGLATILLLALVGTLAGCLPLSIAPLHTQVTEGDLDQRLLGTWRLDAGETAGDRPEQAMVNMQQLIGTWRVTRGPAEPGRYVIYVTDGKDRKAKFLGTLVELGDRHFLDLQSVTDNDTDVNPWVMFARPPVHAFVQVRFDKNGIAVAAPNWNRFQKLLRDQPDLIAHQWVRGYNIDHEDEALPIITGDSQALQQFVKDHLPDDPYFQNWQAMEQVQTGEGDTAD